MKRMRIIRILSASLVVAAVFLASGCAPALYDIELDKVDVGEASRSGGAKMPRANEFEDDVVRVSWTVDKRSFQFSMENKSDKLIRILWNESRFYGIHDGRSRVMHEGQRYIERDSPTAPTTIPAGKTRTDIAIPVDNVALNSTSGPAASWNVEPYLPRYKGEAGTAVGKTVDLILAVETRGNVREYGFKFRVKGSN